MNSPTRIFAVILSLLSAHQSFASKQGSDKDDDVHKQIMGMLSDAGMWAVSLPKDEIQAGTYTLERHQFVEAEGRASQGEAAQMIRVAEYFISGHGCKKDPLAAFKWLEKLINLKKLDMDAHSWGFVGMLYGKLVLPVHQKAIFVSAAKCFQKSLELGNEDARMYLAHALAWQVNPRANEQAFKHYQFLLEKHNSGEAAHWLARLIKQRGVTYPEAKRKQRVAELEKLAALSGFPLAEELFITNVLGRPSDFSREDQKLAFDIAQKRIQQGNIATYDYWGFFYECGIGVESDCHRALELYLEGISKGALYCHDLAGRLYASGKLGQPDKEKAYKHYLTGALAGNDSCMLTLGNFLFHDGLKGKADLPRAIDWFRKAHAKGSKHGTRNLAIALLHTKDPKDAAESYKLWEYIRNYSPREADIELAHCCFRGIGVGVNLDKALTYLEPHVEQVPYAKKLMGDVYLAKQQFKKALTCYEGSIAAGEEVPATLLEDVRNLAQQQQNAKKRRNLAPLLIKKAQLERIKAQAKSLFIEQQQLHERLMKSIEELSADLADLQRKITDKQLDKGAITTFVQEKRTQYSEYLQLVQELSATTSNNDQETDDLSVLEERCNKKLTLITNIKKKLALAESARQAEQAWKRRQQIARNGAPAAVEYMETQVGLDRSEQREVKQAALVRINSQRHLKSMHDNRPNADPSGRAQVAVVVAAEPIETVPGPFAETHVVKAVGAEIEDTHELKALEIRDQVRLARNEDDLRIRLCSLGKGYDCKDFSTSEHARAYNADKLYQLRISKKYRVFVPLKLVDGQWIVVNNQIHIVQPHRG